MDICNVKSDKFRGKAEVYKSQENLERLTGKVERKLVERKAGKWTEGDESWKGNSLTRKVESGLIDRKDGKRIDW